MDLDKFGSLVLLAWILMRVIDAVIKPGWEKAKLDSFWLQYVAITLGLALGYAARIDAFPVLEATPGVGLGLSCLVVGLGPSFIYDLFDKAPAWPPIK